MNELAETDDFLKGKQELIFKLGRVYQDLYMANMCFDGICLNNKIFLNYCFELWFEYYGVGE